MKVQIISEHGYEEALFGLGLSHGLTSNISMSDFLADESLQEQLMEIAIKLSSKDGGHNKFLESIVIWVDITAPRFWWQEFDTYRVGITKQSESTMHTIHKQMLTQDNFEYYVNENILDTLNQYIQNSEIDIERIKNILPEGFLQRRIVCLNYKCLRNMLLQRKTHKLPQWEQFCKTILWDCKYPNVFKEFYKQ